VEALEDGTVWVDLATFAEPLPPINAAIGEASRNVITGPRSWSSSATVVRIFPIREGHRLKLRI
jgi:hypothetical protein